MNTKVTSSVGVGILELYLLIAGPLLAQVVGATITDPSGAAVPDVKSCVQNMATGQTTQANSDGLNRLPNSAPADCCSSVSAEGCRTRVFELTAFTGVVATQTMDLPSMAPSSNAAAPSMQRALTRAMLAAFSPLGSMAGSEPAYPEDAAISPDQAEGNAQGQAKPPAGNPPAPSLGDLGFPPEETRGNPQEQARLDKRSSM